MNGDENEPMVPEKKSILRRFGLSYGFILSSFPLLYVAKNVRKYSHENNQMTKTVFSYTIQSMTWSTYIPILWDSYYSLV